MVHKQLLVLELDGELRTPVLVVPDDLGQDQLDRVIEVLDDPLTVTAGNGALVVAGRGVGDRRPLSRSWLDAGDVRLRLDLTEMLTPENTIGPNADWAAPELRVIGKGKAMPSAIALSRRAPIVIGRGRDADVRVSGDPKVSRAHFRVTALDGGFAVEDMDSQWGSAVRAAEKGAEFEPLQEPRLLRHGEVVRAGDTMFRYEDPLAGLTNEPAAEPPPDEAEPASEPGTGTRAEPSPAAAAAAPTENEPRPPGRAGLTFVLTVLALAAIGGLSYFLFVLLGS
ncbi:MAG: FHA domain-containing protein [Planctomycetota bacterium]